MIWFTNIQSSIGDNKHMHNFQILRQYNQDICILIPKICLIKSRENEH